MVTSIAAKGVELLHVWKKLQVSYYGGKYSIHRLLALQAYSKRASVVRSLVVCIGIPLPMIGLVLVQESVPLQDPREGWRANYGFWVRVVILAFVVCHFSTGQAVHFIDGFRIPPRRLLVMSACFSTIFTLGEIFMNAYVIFPLPFSVLISSPMFNILHIISFRLIFGGRILRQLLNQREQLIKYVQYLVVQISMMFVYPIYELLFRYSEGTKYQILVILLLPVIKIVLKNIVLRCTTHVEDIAPESVIFTVDFFNAVYVATCMQSASSAFTISAIVITDLTQTLIMLYGLHRQTFTIVPRLNQAVHSVPVTSTTDNLLNAVCFLCRDNDRFRKQVRTNVQIRSCFPHELSANDTNLLEQLSKEHKFAGVRRLNLTSNSIHPHPDTSELQTLAVTAGVKPVETLSSEGNNPREQPRMLLESLETLFTIECLVVTAYLEALIPFFYTLYFLVMVHLPSAPYHTEMNSVTCQNVGMTVLPIFVFGLLQILSFVILLFVIKRNCGMHALYQLTFVLEAQRASIQGKLMLWMMITLSFRVVHFGAKNNILNTLLEIEI